MSRFEPELYARALAALGVPAVAEAPVAGETTNEYVIRLVLELVKRFEGFMAHPYLCPAGVPTIGYGSTYYMDGRMVRLGDPPISKETAERLVVLTLKRVYIPAVERQCPGITNPRRKAGLVDFVFNLGEGRLATSTLRRRVNSGLWDEVPPEFRKWVYANGKVLRGLVLRAEARVALV